MKNRPKIVRSENTEEVFLIEASGRFCAADILKPAPKNKKVILRKGSLIGPKTIGDLAAMGIDRVRVYEKPEVSILTIGQGLIAPGLPPGPGKVYDSNTFMVQAALESMRIRPVFMRRLTSQSSLLRRLIPFALNQSDILIVMVSENCPNQPWLREFLKKLKVRLILGKVKEKALFLSAKKREKIVFFLPNDPNFIFDYFYRYIQPAIRSFMGSAASFS